MKEFLFYTYDSAGKDVILTVRADNRAAAFKEFDRLHGEDTPIDFCIERGQEYVEAIATGYVNVDLFRNS